MTDTNITDDAIELLQKMIAIPSFSKEETALADMMEQYIEMKGYNVSRRGNNIWLMSPGFDLSKPTLLLNSHIDTVKPSKNWLVDPFTPILEGDKLIGLGANDAGASVVSLLFAFFELTQYQQSYNLIFAASSEEEISGKEGMEMLIGELPKIDFAIVGEPTEMQMAVAERGLMVLDCITKGVAGHAARNEGENAIYKALSDIEWFKNYEFEKKSDLLGPVKMTITQINSGTQHNVIPDNCTFVVDIRSNEHYSNQELLQTITKNVQSECTPRSTRLSSTASPLHHPIVLKGTQMGLTQYGSPTLSDQALMPFPSLKMGPGHSSRSHTANEYILKSEIANAIETYFQLLNGINIQ